MPSLLQGGTMMTMGKAPIRPEQRTAERVVATCSYALGLMSIGAAVITLALV
ncbi:hypothetical protein ACFQU7_31280 [Pseudoroseomonas wenyumeiae]|uniref:hypothetical protein n=1 Tax=Teichococcus wenyumeiae TaxID=2478470 RepID=UPI00131433E7|nr:hypothetical protein [Pseudoroseomonas wenyumeiae]